jgi:peptidoglycan/LPS O-acetylase OafA/YrhL
MTVAAATAMPGVTPAATTVAGRDAGLDALRGTATLLVLFHHAALTYGATGGWYYREVPSDGRLDTKILMLFCTVNQAWFMGLFFLLAGYFTPGPFQRKGGWMYARGRLLRLGLPLLVYMLAISPLTIALAQTAKGRPFLGTFEWLWVHGRFESGPLWFAQALLIFCGAFLVWRAIAPRFPEARPFPSNAVLLLAALLTGAGAFASRLFWPVGTQVWGLQLGYFSGYVVLFAAGCAAAPGHWLSAVPDHQRRLWLTIAWIALPVLPAVELLAPAIPALRGDSGGGWNIQAVVYAFWEPFVAWGFILGLVRAFQHNVRTSGPLWTALSRRAYAIYIIHPPVLVAVALAWRDVSAPHLVKFAVSGSVTCLLCFWIAGALSRARPIARVI